MRWIAWILLCGGITSIGSIAVAAAKNEAGSAADSAGAARTIVLPTGHQTLSGVHVEFSPDGRRILTASATDRKAILWDAASGLQLRTFQVREGAFQTLISATFSPDGTRIAACCYDNKVVLLHATTGEILAKYDTPGGQTGQGQSPSVAFSSDGKRLRTVTAAAQSGPGGGGVIITTTIAQRDLATGELLGKFDIVREGRHWLHDVPLDWRSLVLTEGKKFSIVDAENGSTIRTFSGSPDTAGTIKVSPDRTRLVSGGLNDGSLLLWDFETGKRLGDFEGHKDRVFSIAFSPDGKRLITTSQDRTVMLWDVESREKLRTLDERREWVFGTAFSPDGRHVLGGAEYGDTILWETETGRRVHTLRGHMDTVFSASFSRRGERLLTGSMSWADESEVPDDYLVDDATLLSEVATVWDVGRGGKLRTFAGSAKALSPDGKRVLVNSWTAKATLLYDVDTGAKLGEFKDDAHFSADGKWVVTSSEASGPGLYDAASGGKMRGFEGRAGTVSPDGTHIVTGMGLKAVLWDARTGKRIATLEGHAAFQPNAIAGTPPPKGASTIYSAAFSADGKRLATGSRDGTAILWDAATGEKLQAFRGENRFNDLCVESVEISPDAKHIITRSRNVNIRHWAGKSAVLWDADSGREIHTFKTDRDFGIAMCFSADGGRIFSGTDDGKIDVRDAATGRPLLEFDAHGDVPTFLSVLADGRTLVSASLDGTIRWSDAATGREKARLVLLDDSDWFVATRDGRFDGSAGGMRKVAFRIGGGLTVLPAEKLAADYRVTGILGAILRGDFGDQLEARPGRSN